MISRWFPPRNADCDYWWRLTGPLLAMMLFEAGYSLHEQYEGMVFHYHRVVPHLGPCLPPNGKPKWKSTMAANGSPFEYSWKWNTADVAPTVRYTAEPVGSFAGTILDPLNQASTRELLYELDLIMPSLDLTWFYHFATALYDVEKEKYVKEASARLTTTFLLAFELLRKDLVIKAYFYPKKLGQEGPTGLDVFTNAIRGVLSGSDSLDKVVQFLKTDPEGSLLQPVLFAIDCVKPSRSRMKLYVHTPHTSFDSVRTIMTLGGQIQGVDNALKELHELIKLIVGLDKDFPSSKELPAPTAVAEGLNSGYAYYFDIAPGSFIPDIKFYIPIRSYGGNDLKIAQGLINFMESRGRGQYTENYMRVLEGLVKDRPLEAAIGCQVFIACAFQNGSLSVTSYLDPELFGPDSQ